jgi:hypothetical protein
LVIGNTILTLAVDEKQGNIPARTFPPLRWKGRDRQTDRQRQMLYIAATNTVILEI